MASLISIEPRIQDILTQELQTFRDTPTMLDELFNGFKQADIDNLKDYLSKNEVRVILGYPKDETEFPCWAITLGGMNVANNVWGDVWQRITEQEQQKIYSAVIKGEIETNIYRVACYTVSQTLTLMLFHLAHHIMLTRKNLLADVGARETSFGGGDLEPSPAYYPVFVHLRVLNVTILGETTHANNDSNAREELRKITSMAVSNIK